MEIVYFTNVGHIRTNNEDAILINEELFYNTSFEKPKFENLTGNTNYINLSVADGMGGHERGEIAAQITLEILKQEKPKDEKELISTIEKARISVEEYKNKHPEAFGLGTAVAGLIISDIKSFVFNVGDCRVYKKVGNFLRRMTRDHTLVEELINKGYLTEEEARLSPRKNILTSAIIGDNYETEVLIYTKEIKYKKNDIFLICSDGLWENYKHEELEELFKSDDLKVIADNILKTFDKKLLKDNVSFVLCKI